MYLLLSCRKNTRWGASNTPFLRFLPAEYEDGTSTPKGWTRDQEVNNHILPLVRHFRISSLLGTLQNALKKYVHEASLHRIHFLHPHTQVREVSNRILPTPTADVQSDPLYTFLVTIFAQFTDHDLTFTPTSPSIASFSDGIDCGKTCTRRDPCFPIDVSATALLREIHICIQMHAEWMLSVSCLPNRFLKMTPGSAVIQRMSAFLSPAQHQLVALETLASTSVQAQSANRWTLSRPSSMQVKSTAQTTPKLTPSGTSPQIRVFWGSMTFLMIPAVSFYPSALWVSTCVPLELALRITQMRRRCLAFSLVSTIKYTDFQISQVHTANKTCFFRSNIM